MCVYQIAVFLIELILTIVFCELVVRWFHGNDRDKLP